MSNPVSTSVSVPQTPAGGFPTKKLVLAADARDRMEEMSFDPITEAIQLFRKLKQEMNYQMALRNRPSTNAEGGALKFSAMALQAAINGQQKLIETLIKHAYGTVNPVTPAAPGGNHGITINLGDAITEMLGDAGLHDVGCTVDTAGHIVEETPMAKRIRRARDNFRVKLQGVEITVPQIAPQVDVSTIPDPKSLRKPKKIFGEKLLRK